MDLFEIVFHQKCFSVFTGCIQGFRPPVETSNGGTEPPEGLKDSLHLLDLHVLHQLHRTHARVLEHYEAFDFHGAARADYEFMDGVLSRLYVARFRTRLYCFERTGCIRLPCVVYINEILLYHLCA